MDDAEVILARLESNVRSYRRLFCLALVGLTTLVAANVKWRVDDVMRAKSMNIMGEGGVVAVVANYNHKIVVGTVKGTTSLVSAGEGDTGAGVIVLSAPSGKNVLRLSTTKSAGGSVGLNGPDGVEIANASPNITNAGSLFIDNAAGALVGELNGDKQNGGAIILHDAQGKETARVH